MRRFHSGIEDEAVDDIQKAIPSPTTNMISACMALVDNLVDHLNADFPLPEENTVERTFNQPLFHRSSTSPPNIVQSLPASGFYVTHETIFNHREGAPRRSLYTDPYDGSSNRFPNVPQGEIWQHPSSSELSSPHCSLGGRSLSSLSNRGSAFSKEEDATKHYLKNPPRSNTNHFNSHEKTYREYGQVDGPEAVLEYMNFAFSEWSHARREGVDAVNDASIGAPPELHDILKDQDEETLSGDHSLRNEPAGIKTPQFPNPGDLEDRVSLDADNENALVKHGPTSNQTPEPKGKNLLTRAEVIARDRAAHDKSILTKQSTSQKRSDRCKNKNRKSIIPSPSSQVRLPIARTEQTSDTQQEEDERLSKMFIFNNNDTDCRMAVDVALKTGRVDPKKESDVEALLKLLSRQYNDTKVAEEYNQDKTKGKGKEIGKSQRIKGRAAREAKKVNVD